MTIRIKQIGANFVYETGPLVGTPVAVGGPNGAVQFNDGNTFGGTSNFTFDNTTNTLTTTNISGSLTRLSTGVSYLVAGANVTITSSSNGQITIDSTGGGGGTPAGSDQYIQFNNGGSFGASANLKFDSTNNVMSLTGSLGMKGSITPDVDFTYTLGTQDKRWQHVYTGDLHLRNDKGDWTIVEERDYLCVVNNITGKRYKMMLQPLDDDQ
jgi:hypothetical protein